MIKKYTFIDLEYDDKKGITTELALVTVTDDFNPVPNSELFFKIDDKKTKNGYIRQGKKENLPFVKIHEQLKKLLCNKDTIVIGWDVIHDANAISTACQNNVVPPLDFNFFDLQKCFSLLLGTEKTALCTAVETLKLLQNFDYHNALEDANATKAVALALCKKFNLSLNEMIENYSSCRGQTKALKSSFKTEKTYCFSDNSISSFNVSLDFPVLEFKKNIGSENSVVENGQTRSYRDGICINYNYLLNKCYHGKEHPGKLAKNSYLISPRHPIFDDKNYLTRAYKKLKKFDLDFYNALIKPKKTPFIVSYDLFVSIKNAELKLFFSNDELKSLGKNNDFVKKLEYSDVTNSDILDFIKTIYSPELFHTAVMKNKKMFFGGKEEKIEFCDLKELNINDLIKEGYEVFIPRAFMYALKAKVNENQKIACVNELKGLAVAKEVVDLPTQLKEQGVKLVTVDNDGVALAYVPFKAKVFSPLFEKEFVFDFVYTKEVEL